MNLLVFTDLDGSLMEHESYSIEPARPALAELAQRGVPVILNSSKTRAEIEAIRNALQLDTPFICENGAALHLCDPDADPNVIEFGPPRFGWLPAVHELRESMQLKFTGFADMDSREVAELTGLSEDEAKLARTRHYSEPIIWRDSGNARGQFEHALGELGLCLLEGGRFLSIQGRFDKGNAMHWLKDHQPRAGDTITVALGDSPNDQAMLAAADVAVVIKSAKSNQLHLPPGQRQIRTRRPGPAGWQDAMTEILAEIDSGKLNPSNSNER